MKHIQTDIKYGVQVEVNGTVSYIGQDYRFHESADQAACFTLMSEADALMMNEYKNYPNHVKLSLVEFDVIRYEHVVIRSE